MRTVNSSRTDGLNEKDVNLDIVLSLSRLLQNDGATVNLPEKKIQMLRYLTEQLFPTLKSQIYLYPYCKIALPVKEYLVLRYHFRGDKNSERLSKLIIDGVSSAIGSKNRGVRTAEFYLLRQVRASTIILHLLYITNPEDAERLANPLMRQKVTEAIYQAILKYYCPMGNV